jgi:hypothetical protein
LLKRKDSAGGSQAASGIRRGKGEREGEKKEGDGREN